MKTLLSILFSVSYLAANAQSWQAVGPDDFKQLSRPGASSAEVYLDASGNAFVSYVQGPYVYSATSRTYIIKKETPTGWIPFTEITAWGNYADLIMDTSGNFYCVDDTVSSIRLRKFNGASWATVAPLFPVSNTDPYLCVRFDRQEHPTVAYTDTGISVFPKMIQWDGVNWNNIGGNITNTTFNNSSNMLLSFDFDSNNIPFVYHYDVLSVSYQIKTFNGTNWVNAYTNVIAGKNLRINQDTIYIADGTDGYLGGGIGASPYSYAYQGTGGYRIGGNGMNTTIRIPCIASTEMDFSADGSLYLNGGTIWESPKGVPITNPMGSSLLFGSTGDLAIKGNDTFYTVDNSEANHDKLRVVKRINNVWQEDFPVSIVPFTGGYITNYSSAYFSNYISVPCHSFFADHDGSLHILSASAAWMATLVNNVWDTVYCGANNFPGFRKAGFTAMADTANDIFLMNIQLPGVGSPSDLYLWKLYGNSWGNVGPAIRNSNDYAYGRFAFDGNSVPYVTFADKTPFGAGRVRVQKYDGAGWSDISVSVPFASSGAGDNPIVICDTANTVSVLYKEGQSLYVRKFDGINWNLVGTVVDTVGNIDYDIAVTEAGEPVVAYLKAFGGKLKPVVKKFDGVNWITLGIPGFSFGKAATPKLLTDKDTLYVTYEDEDLGNVVVAKYNGAHWAALGSPAISRDSASFPILAKAGNDLYVNYYSDGMFVKRNDDPTLVPLYTCLPPSATVNDLKDTLVNIGWNSAATEIVGYEIALNTANTLPATVSFTTSSTYIDSALVPATTYYFFIRQICGFDTSAWDTLSFTTLNATGLDELVANAQIRVYPNPSSGIIYIEQTSAVVSMDFALYDLYGRKIRSVSSKEKLTSIDIEDLPNGVYTLKHSDKERAGSFKVIKR